MCKNCNVIIGYIQKNISFDGFKDLGRHYGYPECCIEEFIHDAIILLAGGNDPRTEDQNYLAKNITHGFMPCKKCMKKMKKHNLNPEDILVNRQAAPGWKTVE